MSREHAPLRWGILSTADIARNKVLPAMLRAEGVEVVALASRQAQAARDMAAEFGIARALGSYEELTADPGVDVIYNPLPNDLHVPWTLAAARAGKHVLCEKPMSLDAAELEALREVCGRVHLREAFMVEFHPQWVALRERVAAGEIGEALSAHVQFSYFNADPANIRNQKANGGGALYDIGCYAVFAGEWCFGTQPRRVIASFDRDPSFGTDRHVAGLLDFGAGRSLSLAVSTQSARRQSLSLVGSRGSLLMPLPFNALPERICELELRGEAQDAPLLRIELPAVDQYRLQAEAFVRQIRGGPPGPACLDQAAARMRVIDALHRSESSGCFETP
ncbi:MAG: Gfo/Idh/MocA family protein [Halothiobacillaceae bacterium]